MIGDFFRLPVTLEAPQIATMSMKLSTISRTNSGSPMSRPLKIRNTLEMIPDDDNDEKYCPFLQYDTGAK